MGFNSSVHTKRVLILTFVKAREVQMSHVKL